MKISTNLNNFIAGEWSPKMEARADAEQYNKAAKTLRNCMVAMQGGVFMRPGFRKMVVAATSSLTNANVATKLASIAATAYEPRIIPFKSGATKYQLVCGVLSGNTTDWFVVGESLEATSVSLSTAISNYGSSVIGDMTNAQYAQVGDLLIITTGSSHPVMLRKEGSTFKLRFFWEYWTNDVTGAELWKGFPFTVVNASDVNGTLTATGTFTVAGTVTLQASTNLEPFYAGMDDENYLGLYMLVDGASFGIVHVTTYTDTNTVTATVLKEIPGASPAVFGSATGTAWIPCDWNKTDSGHGSTPCAVTVHEQRVYFGGAGTPSSNGGRQFWGSRIGNVYDMKNFDPDTDWDSDNSTPWSGTIAIGGNIKTMNSAKTLIFNCDDAEVVAYGTNGALGKLDFTFETGTSFGSSSAQATRVNNYVTFVEQNRSAIRDLVFDDTETRYKSSNLSFIADHLRDNDSIAQIEPFRFQDSAVLVVRTLYGLLLTVTLDRDYNVNAWTKFEMYSNGDGSLSDGYDRIVTIGHGPVTTTAYGKGAPLCPDTLWAIVERVVNSTTIYSLEYIGAMFDDELDVSDQPLESGSAPVGFNFPKYLDGGVLYKRLSSSTVQKVCRDETTGSGASGTTWGGLSEFPGETVHAFADGIYIGEISVNTSGETTLTTAATYLYLGYKYTMKVQPLPIEGPTQVGSSMNMHKQASEVLLRFYKTVGARYGIPEAHKTPEKLHDIEFREPSDNLSDPIPLKSVDKFVALPGGARRKYSIYLESTVPYPCNLLAMVYEAVIYD